jgi:hypothetical protein
MYPVGLGAKRVLTFISVDYTKTEVAWLLI